jgi:hypothetical protein
MTKRLASYFVVKRVTHLLRLYVPLGIGGPRDLLTEWNVPATAEQSAILHLSTKRLSPLCVHLVLCVVKGSNMFQDMAPKSFLLEVGASAHGHM